jgi:hypothetical protein
VEFVKGDGSLDIHQWLSEKVSGHKGSFQSVHRSDSDENHELE